MTVNTDEKEQLINNMVNTFMRLFPDMDLKALRSALYISLDGYAVQKVTTQVAVYEGDETERLIKSFLVTKKVNGCTDKTLHYYGYTLSAVFKSIGKPASQVTTNDLRLYFAKRELMDKVSATSRNNERRALSSFYTWMVDEEIILKNPIRKIPQIKGQKKKKKAFSDMELEKLRGAVKSPKHKAIIEIMISTGCRVSELCQIKITDINGDKVMVHGKGQKDRICYLTAKANIAIQEYMDTDYFKQRYQNGNPYLFARERMIEPDRHLSMDKGGVESFVRSLGKELGIENVHPHRFRRTFATNALARGMPIEQVSKLLGHESIETTQIYLDLGEESLEYAHKKYVN